MLLDKFIQAHHLQIYFALNALEICII